MIDGTGKPALRDAVVLIDGPRIAAVGKRSEIDVPSGARVIDASERTVVPGLIDSHTHFLSMGYRLGHLQLDDAESIGDIVGRLREYIRARRVPKGKWVQGRGWDDQNLAERRYPDRHDVDEASPDNPVALTRICGHMIVLNSNALEACGITRGSPNPSGGVIDKDADGEPTGVLRDARGIVSPHIPPPTYEELRQGLRDAIKLAHSLGATTIHDCSRPDESSLLMSVKPYADAHGEGDMRLRCHVMTGKPHERSGDEWLSFGSMKIGIDGSMGAQTALLYEPYTNDPSTRGVYVGNQERNRRVVGEQQGNGGQIAIHAIGDKAIAEAVSRIEEALEAKPRTDHRHRIEHFEYPTNADIERAGRLGIVASMQPNFVGEWAWPGGMYETRLGEKRNRRSNPYRRLLDLGFHIPFGSDGMPFHPLYGIWSAVNHPIPESRISVEEAVRCYTLDGAYATREEKIKGSIEPGKLADVTILPMDITKPEFHLAKTDAGGIEKAKREMKKMKAYMTILDGEIVYQA